MMTLKSSFIEPYKRQGYDWIYKVIVFSMKKNRNIFIFPYPIWIKEGIIREIGVFK